MPNFALCTVHYRVVSFRDRYRRSIALPTVNMSSNKSTEHQELDSEVPKDDLNDKNVGKDKPKTSKTTKGKGNKGNDSTSDKSNKHDKKKSVDDKANSDTSSNIPSSSPNLSIEGYMEKLREENQKFMKDFMDNANVFIAVRIGQAW